MALLHLLLYSLAHFSPVVFILAVFSSFNPLFTFSEFHSNTSTGRRF